VREEILKERTVNARLIFTLLGVLVWSLTVSACVPRATTEPPASKARLPHTATTAKTEKRPLKQEEAPTAEEEEKDPFETYPGNNNFINQELASKPQRFTVREGEILLNFENTSIREVVKTIVGGKLPY
jgi:general secretion pathway protein D